MKRFVLSPLARADLGQIWDYTEQRWGLDQAETYLRRLQTVIEAVAADPNRGRRCDEIRPGYRKHPAGSHVLFYRLLPDGIDIVRILHRRMDFDRHLEP
jgi:toxin ParE1/3/4